MQKVSMLGSTFSMDPDPTDGYQLIGMNVGQPTGDVLCSLGESKELE